MFRSRAREMVDHMLWVLDDAHREWHDIREIRLAPHFEPLRDRLVDRLVHDLEIGSPPFSLRWHDEYRQVLSRQNDQLERIEDLLSKRQPGCRFAEEKEGEPWYGELVTVLSQPGGSNVSYHSSDAGAVPRAVHGDKSAFISHLNEGVKNSEVIVIVDPYALTDKNDSGQANSPSEIIKKIVIAAKDSSQYSVHLHLYCHKDRVKVKEWEKLKTDLEGHTLSVYLGDFHDRYILTGRKKFMAGKNINAKWHGKEFWGGWAFGASLNGIEKRPTYVLDFPLSDIRTLVSYIRDVAPQSISLDEFKKSKSAGKNAANPDSEA